MEIEQKFRFVEGSFNTKTTKMVCIPSHKYREVELAIKSENDKGWNIPIAKIKLHSRDRFVDADAVFESASKLGEEIARRWNECETKK